MNQIFSPTLTSAAAVLQDRYRGDVPDVVELNATLDLLFSHRSVRAYLPEKLPEGIVETLVAAAQSASSSSNLQIWSVVAVEDVARKARLAALAGNQRHILEAPLFFLWILDLHRLTALGEARGEPAGALTYLESFVLGAVDTALAAQNAVVALESLGLGAVYIGGIRNHPAAVAAELGLPPQAFALFGLAVGKPDPTRPARVKPRLPQDVVLFREKYEWGDAQQAGIAAYNERLRAFQSEQGLPVLDWTVQAGARVRGPEAMSGRAGLRDVLQRLGFGLR
jgi:nitroreductase